MKTDQVIRNQESRLRVSELEPKGAGSLHTTSISNPARATRDGCHSVRFRVAVSNSLDYLPSTEGGRPKAQTPLTAY